MRKPIDDVRIKTKSFAEPDLATKGPRRDFLRRLAAWGLSGALCSTISEASGTQPDNPSAIRPKDAWAEATQILARIKPPRFPQREFNIAQYGAKGDSKSDCTNAFSGAISACHAAGGGRVVVSAGEFLTGAITLLSGVDLHIARNGTIRFNRDPRQYPLVLTRFEGTELMNYSPFIYAFNQENIAVTGEGTIDGNADCEHWWPWVGRRECGWTPGKPNAREDRLLLQKMAEDGIPVEKRIFGEGHFLRPQFIQFYRCKNMLVEGVTLLNSPMWQVHPVLSSNVTVRGLTIKCDGPNTDGCDPESSRDVLISDCFFSTGDDCIAIKSGRNADGRRLNVPCENIVIQNCVMKEGHGGVTIGSEVSGGVRNVFAQDCRMEGSHLYDALRIKTNAMRGGIVENIYARRIQARQATMAGISVDFNYEEAEHGTFTPVVRYLGIQDLTVGKSDYAIYLRGFKDSPIENITLRNCSFENVEHPNVIENVRELTLSNVRINGSVVDHS